MLPELFAIGTGIASLLQKDEEYNRKIKMRDDYTKSLERLLIDNDESTRRIDRVSDMYNPAIMQDLNQTTIGNTISGVLNPTTYSQLIPKKAEAIQRERNFIDERNTTIGEKISQISLMDIPKPGVFDFLEGGIAGYGMGTQVEGMIDENKRQNKMMSLLDTLLLETDNNDKVNKGLSIANAITNVNPFLR